MKKSDFLYLSLYYLLKFIFKILPKKAIKSLERFIAKLAFKINKKHRKIIDINLKICFPAKSKKERDELCLKIYASFAKFAFDFLANEKISKEELAKKIDCDENLKRICALNKNIVFTTAHYGNWELLPPFYAAFFKKISIVMRSLDSELMNKILLESRSKFDVELIDKKNGAKAMLKALKNGRTLGILSDQDASDNEAIRIKFFAKDVNFISAASVIAKKSKALLVPVFVYQKDDDKYFIKSFKELEAKDYSVEELTKYQAKCLEEMIKFKPDEYFFFHKRFKRYYPKIYEEDI